MPAAPGKSFTKRQSEIISWAVPVGVGAIIALVTALVEPGPLLVLALGGIFFAALVGAVLEFVAMRHLKGVWLAIAMLSFALLALAVVSLGVVLAYILFLSAVYR